MKVIDVAKHPRAAEAARVLATPTLVCESKFGIRRVVGDLAETEKVMGELIVPPLPRLLGKTGLPATRHTSRKPARPARSPQLDGNGAFRLIEKSADAIVIVNRAGIVRYANSAASRLLGHTNEELIGHEFGYPVVADKPMELSILRPDRSVVVADLRAVEMKWDDEPAHAAFLRDITGRKQTEAALRASEERFRLMVEGATDYAIVILDEHGYVNAWNHGAAHICGYRSDEILGRHFSCFHTAEDKVSHKAERLLAAARTKTRAEDEGWRVRSDGSRFWANVILTVLKDEEGRITGFCKVTRDMTERQELERRHLELQKRELATQLAKGVAHRFNNIMCGMTIGTELVLLKMREEDDLRPLLETMRTSALRATKITGQLLTFSQNLSSQPQVTDLCVLLQHMESSMREALGHQVRLELNIVGEPIRANVDAAQMEILLLNLATNARDAMPEGGKFTINLTQVAAHDGLLQRFPELNPGEYVKLTLSDTGCGMSEEVQSHLFEPFYTTKDPGSDGLGLAVCHNIVKQNAGCLAVKSLPGRGTSLELYFPKAAEDAVVAPHACEDAVLPRGSENILLVDDEKPLRNMTAASLRELGYQVFEAGDGNEALDLIRSGALPEVHVLVTDGRMPRMGGRTLAREVHALYPGANVLFISGYPSAPNESGVVPEFGASLLQKPFTLTRLARKLREILAA